MEILLRNQSIKSGFIFPPELATASALLDKA